MSQIHLCCVNANVDATRNQNPAVFSVIAVHALVQSALLNHGQLIGTLHHLASVTTLTAAMALEFLLYLVIVYKQTSHKSVPLSTDLSTGCVFRDLLSLWLHTSLLRLFFTTSLLVSSELLRGLSSALLALSSPYS
jgi:hypothetical protein